MEVIKVLDLAKVLESKSYTTGLKILQARYHDTPGWNVLPWSW